MGDTRCLNSQDMFGVCNEEQAVEVWWGTDTNKHASGSGVVLLDSAHICTGVPAEGKHEPAAGWAWSLSSRAFSFQSSVCFCCFACILSLFVVIQVYF